MLECSLLWQNIGLGGESYWMAHFKNGQEVDQLSPEAHEPEVVWSEAEYKIYQEARQQYLDTIRQLLKDFKVSPEFEQQKKVVIQRFDKRALMQDIWVSWGAENKVASLSWLGDKLADTFGETQKGKEWIKKIINTLDEDYDNNFIKFNREYLENPPIDKELCDAERILGFREILGKQQQDNSKNSERENLGYALEIDAKETKPYHGNVQIKKDIYVNAWSVEEYDTGQEYTLIFRFGLEHLSGPPEEGQIIEVRGVLKDGKYIEVASPADLMPLGVI